MFAGVAEDTDTTAVCGMILVIVAWVVRVVGNVVDWCTDLPTCLMRSPWHVLSGQVNDLAIKPVEGVARGSWRPEGANVSGVRIGAISLFVRVRYTDRVGLTHVWHMLCVSGRWICLQICWRACQSRCGH